MSKIWILALALPLLAGCAAQQCDPNSAGLLGGIGCGLGSGYSDRTHALEQQKGVAQQEETRVKGEADQAKANSDAAAAQVQELEQKLASIGGAVNDDRTKIDQMRARNAKEEREITLLKTENDKLQQQIQAQMKAPDQAQVEALKARQAQEREDLLKMSGQL